MRHVFNFEVEVYKALVNNIGVFPAGYYASLNKYNKSGCIPWQNGKLRWPLSVFGYEYWNNDFSEIREEIMEQIMEQEIQED